MQPVRVFCWCVAMLAAALLMSTCGGSPNSPSGGNSPPTLASPQDDAVAAGHPVLTVNNAVTSGSGARTYDFQVADSQTALTGPAEGLFASATGVAEGANGRTSFEVTTDLQPGRRYYWRSRAVQAGVAGQWSSMFRFRTDAVANPPPVIQTMTASARAESRTEIAVSAVVQDQETNPANLVYQWTASAGTFTGTGASVQWQVPSVTAPTRFDLTLTVIERFTVAVAGGADEARENRVSSSTAVQVNDSTQEITTLATTFIDDFTHSDRSPEFCVRNFSDSCGGKGDELNDIRVNRSLFILDPAASSLGPGSIRFFDTGSITRRREVPASQALFAEFLAQCRFASTDKGTGRSGFAIGTCQLTTVYENSRWFLCDSHFLAPAGANAMTLKFRF